MKIDDFFKNFRKDSDNHNAVVVNNDLKWMIKGIRDDINEILELRKRIFYKEQSLAGFYVGNYYKFNSVCGSDFIFNAYGNGKFKPGSIEEEETQVLIAQIVANYFPDWMWENLEFFEIAQEGYTVDALLISFIWNKNGKKGKLEETIEFQIRIPNPKAIDTARVFDRMGDNDDTVSDMFGRFDTYETVVNAHIGNPKTCCKTYDFVCSGYMNSDIIKGIGDYALDPRDRSNEMEK